jgi:hypothetical protein
MIDTDKYERFKPSQTNYQTSEKYIKELLAEVKRLRSLDDLIRSMQRDGIEASAYDNFLSEINRLREDNKKLHDAINNSFHRNVIGSAWEIYNGWWEGEEE